tara:strand:+ start:90 stop:347 length:258 start_codon:yes stop_codon:yes gene_type:complete
MGTNSNQNQEVFYNTNEFEYYSKNIDNLIKLHYEIKNYNKYLGIMNTSKSSKFVNIIMKNISFKNKDIDENNEYLDNENDIIFTR